MADNFVWPTFDMSDWIAFKEACIEVAEHIVKTWEEVCRMVIDCFNKQRLEVIEVAKVFASIREAEARRVAELTKPRARLARVELQDG